MNEKRANEPNTNAILRRRVDDIRMRVLDGLENILDSMTPPPEPGPTLGVARRTISNQFSLWRFCDHSRCRRSGCCRGEPRECLHIGLPLLPLSAIAEIIQPGARAAKRRRRRMTQRPA